MVLRCSEVTIRGISHAIFQATGKSPATWTLPKEDEWLFNRIDNVTIPRPLKPLEERPSLTMVADEESSQWRALNLLAGPMCLRMVPIPEMGHPSWNDCSRAMLTAGVKPAILKGTCIMNLYRGPFRSGRNGYDLQTGARKLLLSLDEQELADMSTWDPNEVTV